MKANLLIIGAGGHGKVVADAAMLMNCWERIVFVDDAKKGERVLGLDVVASTLSLELLRTDFDDAIVALGDARKRIDLLSHLEEMSFNLPSVIHPRSVIADSVEISQSCVVLGNAVINPAARLGRGVIINTASVVEHDCCIDKGAHICPNASLGGNVSIGEYSWIGIGASVRHGVSITKDVIVGAGGVVVKDITASGTYVGNPVRSVGNDA